jgi:hypothetical protein
MPKRKQQVVDSKQPTEEAIQNRQTKQPRREKQKQQNKTPAQERNFRLETIAQLKLALEALQRNGKIKSFTINGINDKLHVTIVKPNDETLQTSYRFDKKGTLTKLPDRPQQEPKYNRKEIFTHQEALDPNSPLYKQLQQDKDLQIGLNAEDQLEPTYRLTIENGKGILEVYNQESQGFSIQFDPAKFMKQKLTLADQQGPSYLQQQVELVIQTATFRDQVINGGGAFERNAFEHREIKQEINQDSLDKLVTETVNKTKEEKPAAEKTTTLASAYTGAPRPPTATTPTPTKAA